VGAERLIPPALVAVLALAPAGCGGDGPSAVLTVAPLQRTFDGIVARVNDGDTVTLRGGAKVRLVQIDAPELTGDCYGRAAKRALEHHVGPGARARFVNDPALDDIDRYGRLLRYVVVRGENVNVELVREGAASPYFFRQAHGRYANELLDAVGAARRAHRGYWGACPGARLDTSLGSITGRR
jgi:micrococcal nuclease